jgi:DNA-binding winged helix-turn-helix (wHTH) protein
MSASFAFEGFVLDPRERRLSRGSDPVDLNARYLDALALLVREQGNLVSKDRFLGEVWAGVPVTDEALTQCIKTLRRQLGDSAGTPRFIETVPKHGYRFIAPVEQVDMVAAARPVSAEGSDGRWLQFRALAAAGTLGGTVAGAAGGLVYGLADASQPVPGGTGALSVLLVLLCVTTLVALVGAAGVSFGIATAAFARSRAGQWMILGGAGGGFVVGAAGKLLGLDAFALLVGHSPGDITGGMEGAILGAAVGLGAWLATRAASPRTGAMLAALCGGVAGFAIALLGGRLMLGSLELLLRHSPGSRLHLEQVTRLFGESDFGTVTRFATAILEGALFAGCIVAVMGIARRRAGRAP